MAFLVALALILFFPASVSAIALSLSDFPSQINFDSELTTTVSLECSSCSDSYLRAVFFPSGTNYFGFTQNEKGEWINSPSDKTQFYKITSDQVISGSWSGILKAKLDPQDSAYAGPGNYNFKVIRYTPSGNKSGETEPVSIVVIGPSPTLTPSPTTYIPPPTTAPSPKPTTHNPQPTSTPVPTSKPTTHNPQPTISPIFTPAFTRSIPSPEVLASSTSAKEYKKYPSVALLVLFGLGIISFSILLLVKR
jgi:hypothetical protein